MDSAYFAIGYKCNHRCLFCPREYSDFDEMMPLDLLKANVDKLINESGIKSITVSGGEPTMHPDFLEFMDYLMKKNLFVVLLTNGDNFCNHEFADQFIRVVNPRQVYVVTAIHSVNDDEHDRLTGTPGSKKRSMDGLKYLRKASYGIGIKFIISKQNYQESRAFTEYILNEFGGVVSLQFCGIDCAGNANQYGNDAAISYQMARPYLEDAADYYIEYKKEHPNCKMIFSELPLCSTDPYYWKMFSLKNKEKVSAYSAPNYKENEDKLSMAAHEDCTTDMESCKECAVKEVCPGVWTATAKILGESALKTQKEAKK